MLFYVLYSGGAEEQFAVVSAESSSEAEEWAALEAEEAYYLDSMPDEDDYEVDEWDNIAEDSMELSTYYHIEEFDEENPDHVECLELQSNEPIEI